MASWARIFALFACLRLAVCASNGSSGIGGFGLLFSNSEAEFESVPIQFAQPLPPAIRGVMVHNGLGIFDLPRRSFVHPFDGLAKLTKIRFRPGSRNAEFSAKFLRTRVFKESLDSGDIAPFLFFDGVQPAFDAVRRTSALFNGLDNTNVNVVRLPSDSGDSFAYLALNDVTQSYQFDLDSLDTVRLVDANESPNSWKVLGFLSRLSSAHPLPEFGTDGQLTFVTSLTPLPLLPWGATVSLVRVHSATGRRVVHSWRTERASYMHSFAATRRHGLLFLNPLYINLGRMVATADPVRSLDWRPNDATRIVWSRLDGSAAGSAFISDGHFLMHHVNAFELPGSNGSVVIADATAYPDLGFLLGITRQRLANRTARDRIPVNNRLRRYRISLATGTVQVLQIPTRQRRLLSLEMPVINENFRYRPYCFVYGVLLKSDGADLSKVSLVKKSMCDAAHDKTWFRDGFYPSEPVFYARRQDAEEDDGFLVSLVLDEARNVTFVAVFDARSMLLVNQADLPGWLPYRLHGKSFLDG